MNNKTAAAISTVFLFLSISGCSTLSKSETRGPETGQSACGENESRMCKIEKEEKPADLHFLQNSD
ncbi:MAG: hypothetical protein ACLFV2_10590 [Desulfurivibrionaceae bacterium]